MQRAFGVFPELREFDFGDYRIEPLDRAKVVLLRLAEPSIQVQGNDWLYPPPSAVRPGVPARMFAPSPTHVLRTTSVAPLEDRTAEFIIVFMGFLKGLLLLPEGWQHFYRIPLTVGSLIDLRLSPSELVAVVRRGFDFWRQLSEPLRRLLFGAVHWYLLSQCYEHPFEVFGGQYQVLDTCWRIHCDLGRGTGTPAHAERPIRMAEHYGLTLPHWARLRDAEQSKSKQSVLSLTRNEYFHEARWGGESIGFAHPRDLLDDQLAAFNSRLLLALMGLEADYVRTRCDTRQVFRLSSPRAPG